jgi:hypothetical protein
VREGFSLTQTTSSSPVITESGNSVTGAYTLVEIGAQAYDVRQAFQPDSIGNSYSLHETGSNATTLTQTGSTVTGNYSQSLNSSDNYTLTETGQRMEAGNAGWLVYTETLTATETSTAIETGNSLNGLFQRSVTGGTGATTATLTETGE